MVKHVSVMIKFRVQIFLFTLPIAGIIGLIGTILRGPFALPIPDINSWAQAATQPIFVVSHFLIIIGYVLPFLGFWAIHKHLEIQNYEGLSFWGFIFCILGTALALPALGITGFAGPIAAQLYLAGNTEAASIISNALTDTGFIISIIAAVFYVLGPILLGIAIWKSSIIPKWIGLTFALHGLCLSFGFSMYPVLIIGWVLLIASSLGYSYEIKDSLA
jgi:hypothetical protein